MFDPSPSGSMTETAYLTLRDDIVSCRLKPGARVKIADLCTRIGANLSAVREALARLLADRLVISEPQKGFQITPVSTKDLTDLALARLEVELLCLRSSMAHAGIEWESRLVGALHRIRRTQVHIDDDPNTLNEEFLKTAEQYFATLMSAADNEWLLRVRQQLYTQYERYRRLTMIGYPNRDMYKEFSDLTDAALSGDLPLAESRLRGLIAPTPQLLDSLMTKVDLAASLAKTAAPPTEPKPPRAVVKAAPRKKAAPKRRGAAKATAAG
jgi:DNA-binding GntR family transcriptional regulator